MTLMMKNLVLWAPLALSALGQLVFNPSNNFQPVSGESLSFPLNLDSLLDNRGFGNTPNDANFDGFGSKSSLFEGNSHAVA
jgi:hypothetical protein